MGTNPTNTNMKPHPTQQPDIDHRLLSTGPPRPPAPAPSSSKPHFTQPPTPAYNHVSNKQHRHQQLRLQLTPLPSESFPRFLLPERNLPSPQSPLELSSSPIPFLFSNTSNNNNPLLNRQQDNDRVSNSSMNNVFSPDLASLPSSPSIWSDHRSASFTSTTPTITIDSPGYFPNTITNPITMNDSDEKTCLLQGLLDEEKDEPIPSNTPKPPRTTPISVPRRSNTNSSISNSELVSNSPFSPVLGYQSPFSLTPPISTSESQPKWSYSESSSTPTTPPIDPTTDTMNNLLNKMDTLNLLSSSPSLSVSSLGSNYSSAMTMGSSSVSTSMAKSKSWATVTRPSRLQSLHQDDDDSPSLEKPKQTTPTARLLELQSTVNSPSHPLPTPTTTKFFVIKSFTEDDIHKSLKYGIWSSTELGNRRLHTAFTSSVKVVLFFSVNGSGHFCGVAGMTSSVQWDQTSHVWSEGGKYKGSFGVEWWFVKDIPNPVFRHLRVATNENKPVTNSRDTQELPTEIGHEMLKIFGEYQHKSCLLDDWDSYEEAEVVEK